jgi:transposase-like protein
MGLHHCTHCGSFLTRLKVAPGAWENRYRCDKCKQRYQVSYGDNRTCSDVFRLCGTKPFDIEMIDYTIDKSPVEVEETANGDDEFDYDI